MEKLFVSDGEVKVEGDVIDLETRLSVIQALIPLGLEAVADLLQQEVEQLAGVRYARKGSEQAHRRWGVCPEICVTGDTITLTGHDLRT